MNFSDELKSQLNIVDVVGHYVRLKRQGAGPRYVGLCPFHSEKTPSFSVHGTMQYFYCFGCQMGGDLFKFVMEHEHLSFPETLKLLADRHGIPMPERQRYDEPEAQERAALMEMNELAADVFVENLRGSNGKDALEYLKSRGVSADSTREFRLGLSDGSGQQLATRLQRFGSALMEKSGLLLKRTEGLGFYDRFRGRLMFPIHNESGKVIGFGGRALRAGDEPKYLNSPETIVYHKSSVLYNLHRAKIDARKNDRMVLVEGYMDVIGVYAAGVKEVVASSGTALSVEQVRIIKRQISGRDATKGSVILNFDPDEAGARSTEKYISAVLSEGMRVRVLRVPGDLDPDEYIQQNGAEKYGKLLDRAESYFHWLADRARTKFDMRSAEGRVDAFKYLLPALQQVHDRVERGAIANELAEYLNVDRETIRESLRRPTAGDGQRKMSAHTTSVHPNEKLLIACLLASHEARMAIREYLRHANVTSILELKEVFEAVLEADDGTEQFSTERVFERLDDRGRKILTELSFTDLGVNENDAPQQALHCLEELERIGLSKRRDALKKQIREAEQSGNLEEAIRLMNELTRLEDGLRP